VLKEVGLEQAISATHVPTTVDFDLSIPASEKLAEGIALSRISCHAKLILMLFKAMRIRRLERSGGLSKMRIEFIVDSNCNGHCDGWENKMNLKDCVKLYALSFIQVCIALTARGLQIRILGAHK
jgi:hypothetical protein